MISLSKLSSRNGLLPRRIKKITLNKYSTKVAIVNETVDKELARTIDKITSIKIKEHKKKPQRPPFAKNLFLGVFDTDILAYPEALDGSAVNILEQDIAPIQDFFDNIDDKRQKYITPDYLSNLSKLKLIGLQVPIFDGGRQLTVTESCRFLEEMAKNTSRIGAIDNEQLGVQMLVKHGTEKHKKYLSWLMNGEAIISFCASEANKPTSQLFQTKATLSPDGKNWIINGTKKLIINGNIADLFIVFVETDAFNEKGLKGNTVKAFIVERGFGGITSSPCEISGLDGTDIADITFDNTPVPAENLIEGIITDNKLISSVLNEYRISKGPILTALLKSGINHFIRHCINIDGGTKMILEADAVQTKIGQLTMALYAIESVTYLTAGLLDQYEKQDCELEAALVKMISTEYTHNSIKSIMDFMGATSYLKDNWCNQLYRDSLGHLLLNEPVDSLRQTIALFGLQHAGIALSNTIRMLRNPFYHAGMIMKKLWTQRRHTRDNPKLSLRLHEYLHPSCVYAAQFLEYSVLRLQFATETLLERHGAEVVNKHTELRRLAECIADIYLMTAVLGRASRSYCIGLRHANLEMEIAIGFSVKAMERVKKNVNQIYKGTYNTADEKYLKIGKYALKHKEYFPVHPLSRNF